jgi:hypothetical protein
MLSERKPDPFQSRESQRARDMTADVINLRQFKRDKARQDATRQAEINRAAFGRSKAQRILEKTKTLQDAAKLDAHRLDRPEADIPSDQDPL